MDKIVCIGKNYLEHAKELGDAVPEKPVLFIKPPSVLRSASRNGEPIALALPTDAGAVHPECEIVLRLKEGGYCLTSSQAKDRIVAVTLGLDMTLRDRQSQLKKAGHPWTTSKVFLDSAVVGPWRPIQEFSNFLEETFFLKIDGQIRQQSTAQQMLFSPSECVAYASQFFPLCEGDLIYTGTPAGVGPVTVGQQATLEWGKIAYSVSWNSHNAK